MTAPQTIALGTCALFAACAPTKTTPTGPPATPDPACALIVTDDDIPSGSATAGALYVEDAALGKRLLTADVIAVARGFRDAGLRCVHVVDSHDGAIDPAPLRAIGARLITPSQRKDWIWPFFGPMKRRYAVAALVGYHAPAGAKDGFRPHTINDHVRALRIDEQTVGEVTHLTIGLSAFGVPVGLVSGDHRAAAEARALIPGVRAIAVRWRDDRGKVRFVSADEAHRRLRRAARRAAPKPPALVRPRTPLRIALQMHSARILAAQAQTLVTAYRGALASRPPAARARLGNFDFAPSVRLAGRTLSWQAPDALSAFVSIVVAASYLRGPDNWDQVSAGYSAFQNGRYHEALRAYRRALERNPFDSATHCRMAAVYQKLGVLDRALKLFQAGIEHIDEISGDRTRRWCRQGRAEVAQALTGKTGPSAARSAVSREEEFDWITETIEAVYSYLAIKQQHHGFSYAELKARARRQVAAAADDKAYRAALQRFLAAFHDGHLKLKLDTPEKKGGKRSPAVTHRWLPRRVLVTRIARLWGDEKAITQQLRRGLRLLRRARALVVDLRGNGGGNDQLVFDYIGRLFAERIPLGRASLRRSPQVLAARPHYARLYPPDPERPGYSRWLPLHVEPKTRRGFAGPIAVLIDQACYSSCEGAALAFKQSGRARLYGQTTGGGSANPIFLPLPRTPGKLMVPTWIQRMPDDALLEDHGVSPHVALAPERDALQVARDGLFADPD